MPGMGQLAAGGTYLDEAVQQVRRALYVGVRVRGHLAEGVKDIVEEEDEVPAGHLHPPPQGPTRSHAQPALPCLRNTEPRKGPAKGHHSPSSGASRGMLGSTLAMLYKASQA